MTTELTERESARREADVTRSILKHGNEWIYPRLPNGMRRCATPECRDRQGYCFSCPTLRLLKQWAERKAA